MRAERRHAYVLEPGDSAGEFSFVCEFTQASEGQAGLGFIINALGPGVIALGLIDPVGIAAARSGVAAIVAGERKVDVPAGILQLAACWTSFSLSN